MSKLGWRAFLDAEGVDDWVVLHGGATAAFRLGSLAEVARLAEAVASVSGLEAAGGVLTPRPHHVRLERMGRHRVVGLSGYWLQDCARVHRCITSTAYSWMPCP